MANEITFKVTGEYKGKAAFAEAKKDAEGFGDTTERASKKTRGLGDEVEGAGKKVKGFAVDLRDGETALQGVDRKIGETRKSIKSLAEELVAAGDETERIKISEKLKVDRSTLSDLQKLRRELGGLAEDGEKVASTFASAFQGGILETLKSIPGEAKVAIAAGLLSLAAMAAPLIGAIINSGILLGIGAGGLAAGIAVAMKDPAVSASFTDLGGHILRSLTDATKPFRSQLIQTASIFTETWDRISPKVSGIFDKLAPKITALAHGFGNMIENSLPGIERAVEASLPLIDALVKNLPQMGTALSKFFDSMAEGGPGAAKALTVVLLEIEVMIVAIGKTIEYLGKMYDAFSKVAEATGEFLGFGDDGKVIARPLDEGTASADRLADSFAEADRKMAEVTAEIERMNKAFEDQFGILMNVDEATIKYQQAVDDLASKWDKSGKKLDANTQAGRDNLKLIESIIVAARDERDAAIAAGDGTAESYNQANAAYLQQLKNLRAQLKALGANTTEVDKLIAKYEELAKPLTKTININIKENVSVSGQGVISGGDLRRMTGGAYDHGGIPRADSGMVGSSLGGGFVQVSERKREMALLAPGVANLPPGSTILPNSNTEQALGGGPRGGMALVVDVRPGASDALMDEIVKNLRYRVRYQGGGSAEAYFGQAS